MAQDLLMIALGAFIAFVGYLNILNVRRAMKTGIVYGRGVHYDRRKNPKSYAFTLVVSFTVAIVLPIMGLGILAGGVFFMSHGL